MDRKINLDVINIDYISISSLIDLESLVEVTTIIFDSCGDLYYIVDDIEKIKDVSSMPSYIKEDWVNENKRPIDISVLNNQINKFSREVEYEKREVEYEKSRLLESNYHDSLKEKMLTLDNLISIRRDVIISGVITK